MLWSPRWAVWGGGSGEGDWWGPLTPGSPAVENPSHCDFVKLRTMLVRTHMQDLKDVTRETHYENYRTQCIQSMTRMVVKERNRKYGAGSGAGLWGGMGQPLFSLGWHWGGPFLAGWRGWWGPFVPTGSGARGEQAAGAKALPSMPPRLVVLASPSESPEFQG